MTCPICKKTQLVIKNNNYFCPTENIYIGPVDSATLQSQIKEASQVVVDKSVKDYKSIIKSYVFPLLGLAIFLVIYYSLPNLTHYLSVAPLCNISINEKYPNDGFRNAVADELNNLRSTNKPGFEDVCQNISQISEYECPVSDEGDSGNTNASFVDHCFVKGTKSIYLLQTSVSELLPTAQFSKQYWSH